MDLRELRTSSLGVGSRHPWEIARAAVVRRLLLDSLGDEPLRSIIDIGCGDAFLAESLLPRFPGSRYVGVDTEFRPQQLAEIRHRLTGLNVTFHSELADVAKSEMSRRTATSREANGRVD